MSTTFKVIGSGQMGLYKNGGYIGVVDANNARTLTFVAGDHLELRMTPASGWSFEKLCDFPYTECTYGTIQGFTITDPSIMPQMLIATFVQGGGGGIKYACVNGICSPKSDGTFTDPNCNNTCVSPAQKYACVNGICSPRSDGTFMDPNCNNTCSTPNFQIVAILAADGSALGSVKLTVVGVGKGQGRITQDGTTVWQGQMDFSQTNMIFEKTVGVGFSYTYCAEAV